MSILKKTKNTSSLSTAYKSLSREAKIGAQAYVTDIGSGCTLVFNGSKWMPISGGVVVGSNAAPEFGVAFVTGTTDEQYFELCNLNYFPVGSTVIVDASVNYTGSNNTKIIGLAIGRNNGNSTALVSSIRNTVPDTGIRFNYKFTRANMSQINKHSSLVMSFGGSSPQTTITVPDMNSSLLLKLSLASPQEQIALMSYVVTIFPAI